VQASNLTCRDAVRQSGQAGNSRLIETSRNHNMRPFSLLLSDTFTVIKYSRAIRSVNVEIKTNVSETGCGPLIMESLRNDQIHLYIYISEPDKML
jgi:hypothetical protein